MNTEKYSQVIVLKSGPVPPAVHEYSEYIYLIFKVMYMKSEEVGKTPTSFKLEMLYENGRYILKLDWEATVIK